MEKNASLWAYLSAGVSGLFGVVTLEAVALWVGIITALFTAGWNWYTKREELKLKRKFYGKIKGPDDGLE